MTDRLEQIKKNQTSPYSSNADCIYLLYELAALRAERDYWKNECAEQDRARTQMAHNSIEKDNRLAALRAENERLIEEVQMHQLGKSYEVEVVSSKLAAMNQGRES